MRFHKVLYSLLLILLLFGLLAHPNNADAESELVSVKQVNASDLILAMNTLRVSNGLPALIEDPIIDAVAQSTASIMAINSMSWHIGDVRGRLAAAGYGDGGTVWATENFAVSSGGMGIDQIMAVWADPDHMRPAVNPAYCNVGAGVATANGKTYYILQAAYVSGKECGSYTGTGSPTSGDGGSVISQIIIPVEIATADKDGNVYHEVQSGQSYWSIAVAYQITIHDIEVWNNTSQNIPLQAGQKLFIPGKNTEGFATPTPLGMVALAAPDANGRIIHEVQPYQSLINIAEVYHVSVDQILALNSWQVNWPLQVGQKLLITHGNVTPSATLSPIQMLTPDNDGRYFHTIQSGETLSWIASLYNVPLTDLMNWNGLTNESVLQPLQKLLLQITPPPTVTPEYTPLPPTYTPTSMPSFTPSATSTPDVNVEVSSDNQKVGNNTNLILGLVTALLLAGFGIWWKYASEKKHLDPK